MALQFIRDDKGNPAGVFIPIEDWLKLKSIYNDLEKEEVLNEGALPEWQQKLIDERLNDYYKNPSSVSDFDKTIERIGRKA